MTQFIPLKVAKIFAEDGRPVFDSETWILTIHRGSMIGRRIGWTLSVTHGLTTHQLGYAYGSQERAKKIGFKRADRLRRAEIPEEYRYDLEEPKWGCPS